MAALPYMPLYVADYLVDTPHLTAAQHGVYLLLIMSYWQRGKPLPDDDDKLAKIARVGPREWARMKSTIRELFTVADGVWTHSRIERELARVEAKSLKSKKAAQASVERRFGERSADADAGVEPTDTDKNKERKKEETGGGRPPTSYAFFGQTIRLTPQHLDRWRRTYHTIGDIEAELTTLDAWWEAQPSERRKHWFHPTAGMLNRKHQENLAARSNYDSGKITV